MQSQSPRAASKWAVLAVAGGTLIAASSGCTPASLALTAVGIATDTNLTWNIVKYVHAKLTEDDPVACRKLDSVQRALSTRCGEFVPGSLNAKDIDTAALQACPLMVATRDPRLWPVLPELLAKGARPDRCTAPPLLALAQLPVWQGCPDFSAASPQVLQALAVLGTSDPRAVSHDVVRMLSRPGARSARLDRVLTSWHAAGLLQPERVAFGVLGALHPAALVTPFAHRLETEGHTAQAALLPQEGVLAGGFEAALRQSDWTALDWWLARVPALANSAPPRHAGALPWQPLAKLMAPNFLARPETQHDAVVYLLARGADPRQPLPYSSGQSVLSQARANKHALVALLDAQPVHAANTAPHANADSALRLAGR